MYMRRVLLLRVTVVGKAEGGVCVARASFTLAEIMFIANPGDL